MPFYIQNVETGLVMDVKDGWKKSGGEIIMYQFRGSSNQLWKYKYGMIFSKHSGLVLDVDQTSQNGRIITHKPHDGTNQKWFFDPDFTIRSATGGVMDVQYGDRSPGASVVAFWKNGQPNQRFRIVPYSKK